MKVSKHAKKHSSRKEVKSQEQDYSEKKEKKSGIESKTEKALPGKLFPIVSAVIIVVLLTLIIILLIRSSATSDDFQGDQVKVEFYVMSQCPYGTQVEDGFYPVLQDMGEAIDFHLDYIVQEQAPGQFRSLHGEPEVQGNIAQLCAMKYYLDDYKYMDFIICQNKDYQSINTNWQACANQNNIDVNKLGACLAGEEGITLLRDSMQKAMARSATASPTIYINNESYRGQRDALSFKRAVCKFVNHEACESIPACASDADCTEQKSKIGVCNNAGEQDAYCLYEDPVEVEYIILNLGTCKGSACDATRVIQTTQQIFLGAKPKPVDAASPEGKAFVEKYNITVVPAYLFEESVTQTKTWKERDDLKTAFDKVDDMYKLKDSATGANYYVSDEARQAHYETIGVVLGDNKPQIDFFVMSYCPYGNQAEEGIEPAYQLLKDYAEFNPKYVIYSNYGGGGPTYCLDEESQICSMHGIIELNQNIREACVLKHIGISEWFEFALKMNKEANSKTADEKWEEVATSLGLDIDVIKACFEDEGEALMAADKALGDALGVRGSPSVFIEGESYSGGRTPEAYKQALCAAFDEAPDECNTVIGEDSGAASAEGSC